MRRSDGQNVPGSAGEFSALLRNYVPVRAGRRSASLIAPESGKAAKATRVVIYARFSTRSQHESSIEAQIESCETYAAQQGFVIVARQIDRAKSGAVLHRRTGLRAVLTILERGEADVILVRTLCRLSRSLFDLHEIRKWCAQSGIEIHEAGRGRIDGLEFSIRGAMAEEERAALIERQNDGLVQAAREGRLGRIKFGYCFVRGKRGQWLPDDQEAPVVRDIFARIDRGESVKSVAAYLAASTWQHVRLWNPGSLRTLLRDPVYMGIRVHGTSTRIPQRLKKSGRVAVPDHLWSVVKIVELGIIDEDQWRRVQDKIGSPAFASLPYVTTKKVLSGKPHCARCGKLLTLKRNSECHPYIYRCMKGCPEPVFEAGPIEQAVLSHIDQYIRQLQAPLSPCSPEAIEVNAARRAQIEVRLAALERELASQDSNSLLFRQQIGEASACNRALRSRVSGEAVDVRALQLWLRGERVIGADGLVSDPAGIYFPIMDALVISVDLKNESSVVQMRLKLDLSSLPIEVPFAEMFPTVEGTVARDESGHAAIQTKKAEAKRTRMHRIAASPAYVIPKSAIDELDVVAGLELREELASCDWSISSLVRAMMFLARTGAAGGDVPAAFGPAEHLKQVLSLVRDHVPRSDLIEIARRYNLDIEDGIEIAYARMFFRNIAPSIDAAMTSANILELKQLASSKAGQSPHLSRVVEWLADTAVVGRKSLFAIDDLELTLCLATLRLHGRQRLVEGALVSIETLKDEIDAWASSHPKLQRRAHVGRLHLDGERATEKHAIVGYRACGPAGLYEGGQFRRLTTKQYVQFLEVASQRFDEADPTRPMSQQLLSEICADRFGCDVAPWNVARMLSPVGIKLPYASPSFHPPKRHIHSSRIAHMKFSP